MVPQEHVMALEVPDRVECLEEEDRGGGDPHGLDLKDSRGKASQC